MSKEQQSILGTAVTGRGGTLLRDRLRQGCRSRAYRDVFTACLARVYRLGRRLPALASPTIILFISFALTGPVAAERIKDMASVQGVRGNQLVGYGLVVGLSGTGDQTSQTPFTVQSVRAMLAAQGVTLPGDQTLQLQNVAAVMVTAELPAFAKPGQRIDITASSLGNAESLRGGTLLMTPLKGADGEVYGIAQGNVVVGGFGASGADGSSVTVNVPSVGRIPNGATVEREVKSPFGMSAAVVLNLHTPDFTTAKRMSDVINDTLGADSARAADAVSVRVRAPQDADQRVSFISFLENLEFEPGAGAAKVIVNARTGTIVIGRGVRVTPAAVTHGSLTVTISEDFEVSQPGPFSEGQTVVTPGSEVQIEEENNPMFLFDPGTELSEIVNAVNRVGASPSDLVAILESLKQAGALRAELIII